MLRIWATALALLMMATASDASTRSPEVRAARAAAVKGYTGEKAKCYTEVSKQYYRPGTSSVPGRSAAAWHVALWNQCGISR
jgi:hypothetical protein